MVGAGCIQQLPIAIMLFTVTSPLSGLGMQLQQQLSALACPAAGA